MITMNTQKNKVRCRTANISTDSFIEAVMMATQRKEGPLDEMGCMAQRSAALINIKTLHVVTIATVLVYW